jgi:hypothetical protein
VSYWVVAQSLLTPVVEGSEEQDIVGLAVLPRGDDPQPPHVLRERKIESSISNQEIASRTGASHQLQKPLCHFLSLTYSIRNLDVIVLIRLQVVVHTL